MNRRPSAGQRKDDVKLSLPPGFVVDEVPEAVKKEAHTGSTVQAGRQPARNSVILSAWTLT
ncbi:MAG TPA: hypothetical protein VE398_19465, partial [Acidobacteriota bacterium]|nr:hypothetical protein [Acidobacteriota bacterium]